MLAVEELVVVLVGDQERPLLDEVDVEIVAKDSRQRSRLDLTELIERESGDFVMAVLVVESIAELQVTELLGNNALKYRQLIY